MTIEVLICGECDLADSRDERTAVALCGEDGRRVFGHEACRFGRTKATQRAERVGAIAAMHLSMLNDSILDQYRGKSGHTCQRQAAKIHPKNERSETVMKTDLKVTVGLPFGEPLSDTPHRGDTAADFLQRAKDLLEARGEEYDTEGGERSMEATCAAFAAITGHELAESEGWLFMEILKNVRQWSRDEFHRDSAEDGVSYAALKAEALAREG